MPISCRWEDAAVCCPREDAHADAWQRSTKVETRSKLQDNLDVFSLMDFCFLHIDSFKATIIDNTFIHVVSFVVVNLFKSRIHSSANQVRLLKDLITMVKINSDCNCCRLLKLSVSLIF